MSKKILYLFIILSFLFLPAVFSEEQKQEEETSQNIVWEYNPLRKISRGVANTALCWVEIPRQAVKVTKEKGESAGIFWGPLKGLTYMTRRFCVGVYEVVTFLVPPYKPLLEPEFVFSEEGD
ncbi:MAG: exosortase system-associated protein, TIGR04073 family [Candidatus Omnitrophica bacterium]|nr:exosortase system-associated protein, TIGR04073 family [Candidatus Omnitrophota bacterium]MCM8830830.1 exosortase system-associated protein, TIGR04073 family [Candidatus Omnitrophota bacterium]